MSMEGLREARTRWMREMSYYRALEAEETVEYYHRAGTAGREVPSSLLADPIRVEDHEAFVIEEMSESRRRIKELEAYIRELR